MLKRFSASKPLAERGFTLPEILIVLALVSIVGSFALFVSFDAYRSASVSSERDELLALLRHARMQSMDDECEGASCSFGQMHGVAIVPGAYALFQGSSYAARDQSADSIVGNDEHFSRSGLTEVSFATSSGIVSTPGAITITDESGASTTISIGSYGQISWQ